MLMALRTTDSNASEQYEEPAELNAPTDEKKRFSKARKLRDVAANRAHSLGGKFSFRSRRWFSKENGNSDLEGGG